MRIILVLAAWALLLSSFHACESAPAKAAAQKTATEAPTPNATSPFPSTTTSLDRYWYQGKAEVSVYELAQNRYQDVHPGQAVLIFVTEDFLTDKQVKNDNYKNPNSVPILKLNAITRFTTGIYDYSIMSSVFTPVRTAEQPFTLKVTNSVQDWCGQVFGQINYRNGQYEEVLNSYFENEGDQSNRVPATATMLEDELMNRIRMGWESLPVGEVTLVPSLQFLRLRHKAYAAHKATASLGDYEGDTYRGEGLKVYRIAYPDFDRTLELVFQAKAPHLIEGWQDTYPSAFDGQKRTTTARRQQTVLEPYWEQNKLSDTPKRKGLGI